MSHIATLISNPAEPAVDDALLRKLSHMTPGAGPARILNPGIAADLPFEAGDIPGHGDFLATLRDELAGLPVDLFVQKAEGRRKRLLLADMDSTMIGQECIDELAAEVGVKEHIAAITERAMRGEIAFEPALRERVSVFKGLPVAAIQRVIDQRITLTPGGRTLVQTMKADGARCALVSGGFTHFTGAISKMIGFDENHANTLETDGDMLACTLHEPILGKDAKLGHLKRLTAEVGLDPSQTMAVGDGANDLAMIQASGLGVAFHAKPAVAVQADARIDHGDLTALLYLQGYGVDEFTID
ncbi:phosphoserine phosphatase SerB [Breoghania sp.]|uniref:phosphoserine phosphatase SerB n=1 Tax=Breoghania sp. TaxID=2065378 RepID=UPI002619BFE6|nr:phosphoserine phosphatase SerB [Breoghania sp.]MDJ0931194.1 phosphoserine phosphatase SerB [Breoghania sp.]